MLKLNINVKMISLTLLVNFFTFPFIEHPFTQATYIMFCLWPLVSILAFIGIIPILGPLIYLYISGEILYPHFFEWFPEVYSSWVTETIRWTGFGYSVVMPFVFVSLKKSDKG